MPETPIQLAWPRLAAPPAQAPRTVHVWAIALPAAIVHHTQHWAWLSPQEQQRASRLRRPADRQRFIACRGVLRQIVAQYVPIAGGPGAVQFVYGPQGKPALAGCTLAFNLSHSADLALLAIASIGDLGVDVEHVRPIEDLARLAARFFSPREAHAIAATPPDRRQDAFFACWTRKEAYIKALGEGLFRALDRFAVTVDPAGPARLAWVADDPGDIERNRWQMWNLTPAPGYAAALVADRNTQDIACYAWHP